MLSRIRLPTLLATGALALAGAAPADAAFQLTSPTVAPADLAAGATTDVKIRVEPREGQIKDLDLALPPGLVGDPNATTRCTLVEFQNAGCRPATQIGRTTTSATVGPLPQNVQGAIYNVEPRGDEPALLGIELDAPGGPVLLESPVRSRQDGGLTSTLRNIPREVGGLQITITALDITLFGRPPGAIAGRGFMRNPTSCRVAETTFTAVSYANERAEAKASFTPTKCEALAFSPGFAVELGEPGLTGAGDEPPITTTVSQGGGEAGVRRVAVSIPPVLTTGFDALRRACPAATFAAGQCPPTARVGSATAVTPLLDEPLRGAVSFIAGEGLPGLVLQLRGPLGIDLSGTNAIGSDGGLVTTFDNLPDVPLSRFELAFSGGPESGLLTLGRNVCVGRAPRFSAAFVSQSGVERSVTVPARLSGCGPQLTGTIARARTSTPTLRVRADAGTVRIRTLRVRLPRGLRAVRAPRVTGSGAGGARAVRRGTGFDVRVPARSGARSVSLTFARGSLRSTRRSSSTPLRVELVDVRGQRTTRTVLPSR